MPQGQGSLMQMVPILFMFLVVYMLVFRPEKKKQQEHKKQLEALQKHDRVITAGGLHGTVVAVKDKTVTLRVDDNVKIEFDKEAIATVVKDKVGQQG